jgi:hypothetical protein
MWFLYADESGDLGFDFVNKKPSKYFTLIILALSSYSTDRQLAKAVKKTLARKLNPRNKRKRIILELKGSDTVFAVKEYFYKQVQPIKFGLYTITINKRKVIQSLMEAKERVYNYITRLVLDKIPLESNSGEGINLVMDKCKGKPEVQEFNRYIRRQLQSRIKPQTPLHINHLDSKQSAGLQACDMFCWGIFRKYERQDLEWYQLFIKDKIKFEEIYFNQ